VLCVNAKDGTPSRGYTPSLQSGEAESEYGDKASERRQCRTRIQGCIHRSTCRHTATFRVMQVRLIQVRLYAVGFTTARAVQVTVHYCNHSTHRASGFRLNSLTCIHDSIHRDGRVQETPVIITSHSSIPVHRVSKTLTLNSS